ncbi:SMI1/KNR4 family protein [Leminorella grimontii]|uniref:SMI1/KNR4 family protein n=1 Tax=Leminorella grimontii TaxID=82981 RepID=UPI00321FFA87
MTKTQKNILIGAALCLFFIVGSGMAYIWYNVLQRWDSRDVPTATEEHHEGVYVANGLGDDQVRETLILELNGSAFSLKVDADTPTNEVALPPITTIVPYKISGEALMEGGASLTVTGGGALLPNNFLKKEMAKAKTMAEFYDVWQKTVAQLNRHGAGLAVKMVDADFSPQEIAKAQARLGVKLPSYYLELAHEGHAWQVTGTGKESGKAFRLLAPSELISAADWVEKNVGSPEWKTARADVYRQLKKEVVFAVSSGEPWVIRYGDKPCEDGRPPVYTGYIDKEHFLIEDSDSFSNYTYRGRLCSGAEDLAFWHPLMGYALRDVLPEEAFTFVDKNSELRVTRASESPEGELKGYLQGEWF